MSAFGVILLQKSKIERRRKSRQGGFLDAPAAARLSGANTKVGGCFGMKRCGPSRLSARSASAVFKIFALRPKNTFATISGTKPTCRCSRRVSAVEGDQRIWLGRGSKPENDPSVWTGRALQA